MLLYRHTAGRGNAAASLYIGYVCSCERVAGGIDAVIDPKAKDADTVALVQYLAADQKFEKVLDNQQILREPIVRNGRQATVGYEPDVWKGWE